MSMSMIRSDATIFLVSCLIAAAGCAGGEAETFQARQPATVVVGAGGAGGGGFGLAGLGGSASPPYAHAEDKVDGRWLAQWPSGITNCPLPTKPLAFSAPTHLFGEGALAPALAVFCVYEHAHASDPDDPPTFMVPPVALSRDRSLISPLAPAVSVPLIGAELRAATLERAGASGATAATLAALSRPATRVAVIDSTQDGAVGSAGSPAGHGRDIGRIIREISCPPDAPGPGCFAHLGNEAALLYDATGAPVAAGGQFGSLGDLARAINRAVVRWEKDPAHLRLIVNLSLGWIGQAPDDDPAAPASVDARAVLAAMQRATCAGALVIAAAGNETRASNGGPLYPAAWQGTSTSPALCGGLLTGSEQATVAADPALAGQSAQPPVWAVGDVDGAGAPLFNHRTGARPPLVAYGYAASVADDPLATSFTEELTGTSASAAVVSGIAAVLWALEPQLAPRAVIDRIHDGGAAVDATADFDFCQSTGCAPRPVRRALLCGALSRRTRCWLPGLPCPPVFSCEDTATQGRPNVRLPAGSRSMADGILRPVSIAYQDKRVSHGVITAPPTAAGILSSVPPPDCVLAPWVCPQPEPVHCSPCFIDSSANRVDLFMNLTSSTGITRLRLQIDGQSFPLDLTTPGLLATSPPPAYVVTGISAATPQQATLEITRSGVQSTQAVLISN
jgi:hypothetical protein